MKVKTTNVDVAGFWKELRYEPQEFNKVRCGLLGLKLEEKDAKGDFEDYASEISGLVHQRRKLAASSLITFYMRGKQRPIDHPNSTQCRPDLYATTWTGDDVHWTAIDATVEIHSARKSSDNHAASYASYLLQARPDRLAVQGFYARDGGVMLIITSGKGIVRSPLLDLKDPSHTLLLYAFIERLYDPHPTTVDPTVERRFDPESGIWLFDITLTLENSQSLLCSGYRIMYARACLDQRAHIFSNKQRPAVLDGVPIPIIKDAYCGETRFREDEIIEHIHRGGEVPGVVRMAHSEVVRNKDGYAISCDGREKTRLGLTEYGTPFMELRTPIEVLIAIYDLLESTRAFHKNKVLHRDISEGNIMFKESVHATSADLQAITSAEAPSSPATTSELPAEGTDKNSGDSEGFCGAKYLLGYSTDRRDTSNLLIDLERGEIIDERDEMPRSPRTGTIRFMARAVRATHPFGRIGRKTEFDPIPELSPELCEIYGRIFPGRLARFPHDTGEHTVFIKTNPRTISTRHALRHDAESAYWLLLWWIVNATPASGPQTLMDRSVYYNLTDTSESDQRKLNDPDSAVDPSYAPLANLLIQLEYTFAADLHWATDKLFTDAEFLHEAFQRHVLNFIIENKGKPFMHLLTTGDNRHSYYDSCQIALSERQLLNSLGSSCNTSSAGKRGYEDISDGPAPNPKAKKRKTSALSSLRNVTSG